MNKKQYFILERLETDEGVWLKPIKKLGNPLTITNSKFTFFENNDGKITNGETGLHLGYDIEKIKERTDLDKTIQEHIDFFGLIKDFPKEGKKFDTIFTKYKDEFKRIFKIDMINFRDSMLHHIGYDSFDIISFDEDFIKTKTEVTGKSTKDATIEKFGQEGGKLIDEILDTERTDKFRGLIKIGV